MGMASALTVDGSGPYDICFTQNHDFRRRFCRVASIGRRDEYRPSHHYRANITGTFEEHIRTLAVEKQAQGARAQTQ